MKKNIILVGFLVLSLNTGFSQVSVCRNDSLHFQTQDYRGEHFWQQSANGADWSRISGEDSMLFDLKAVESMYYRYEVLEGTCNPYYSETIQVIVNQPPIVILENIDSVCFNANAFTLRSGTPVGGHYWGDGVIDGRFVASNAGAGTHDYFYRYQNPESLCADTAVSTIRVLPLPTEANAGEDLPEILEDSLQLQANLPTSGTGIWTITAGEGGYLSDPTDPQAWFHKGPNDVQYTLDWTVENTCGTS